MAIVPSNKGANIRGDVRARAERLFFMRLSVVTDRRSAVRFREERVIGGLAKVRLDYRIEPTGTAATELSASLDNDGQAFSTLGELLVDAWGRSKHPHGGYQAFPAANCGHAW